MITIGELKQYVASTSILCIIICKFCYKQKFYLIILLLIDKSPEVNFYCDVLSFGLVIYLRIEGSQQFLLDIKKVA